MKVFIKGLLITFTIGVLAMGSARAGDKSKTSTVTFASDTMVNGTLVKAGEYQVKFDEKSGELAIMRDGKVKAKAPARLESRSEKAKNTAIRTVEKGSTTELIGVTFDGWNQDVVVSNNGGTVTGG
jgi:hypothetical protein